MEILNMYDKNKKINEIMRVFNNNKSFYMFYDEEKDDNFLRKNNKNYTGKYEEIKNSIDSNFNSNNYYLPSFFHKETSFYENGKREGLCTWEFWDSNIKIEINYKNGLREGKYSIYRFSKKQNKIVRIYEEGEFVNGGKILVTQYYYNRKDELEIKTIDFKKFEETLIFRDGTKIVKEIFRYRVEMISFNLPISSSDRGLLKACQYKDDKLRTEAIFSAGILKKLIHYDEDKNISGIGYFDIYYDNEIKEFNSFNIFKDKKDFFEDSILNKKNLKIYDDKNKKYLNYPNRFINGENDIKLQLKILKDDINPNTNFGYNDNDLKSPPKYTEYFNKNRKIFKRIILLSFLLCEYNHTFLKNYVTVLTFFLFYAIIDLRIKVGEFMERFILNDLIKWKNSKYRKPLILKGVRQVGKTWILKEFGNRYYENVAYFNFDENPEYKQFFQTTKDINRILQNLILISGYKIVPEKTLIIFDEVQDTPEVINSLKYFYENSPEYHIACAGSLLGISLAKPSSFPVGKVEFLNIYPMSFSEFLLANGDENLKLFLDSLDNIENIPDAFFNPLYEKLKMYYVTGGMPEAVYMWTQERDIELVRKTLNNILEVYERDFAKHPNIYEFPKISMIWKSIPSQLSKENKKFIYKVVKEGARAREYEDALQWLVNANLVTKVFRCSAPRIPLSSYDDISAFKIYLVDVGLLVRLSQLSPSTFGEGNRLFTEFKGALTENYILQGLIPQFEVSPRYWTENNYEIDFIIQNENDIIPIEVKAETNIKSKNLQKFKEKFREDIKLRVRFSLENLKFDDNLLNIPLFMVDYTEKLINIALNKIIKKEKNSE